MSFCDHCEGQRFDRARVLRALRQLQKELREGRCPSPGQTIALALEAVRNLDIPHVEFVEPEDEVIH